MDKEMLDIVNDLSKKPTTELVLKIMELSGENLILEQQCKKQKEIIDKAIEYIKHYETIRGYYEYEECGYDEYNYEEDLKEELLDILKESGE